MKTFIASLAFGMGALAVSPDVAVGQTAKTQADSALVASEIATMKSYLRSLVTAQEAYFIDHNQYAAKASEITSLKVPDGLKVDSLHLTSAGHGWSGTVMSQRLPSTR